MGARRRALLLVACCVVVNVSEGALALAFGVPGGAAIAPQVAAPAPLGVFSDLRWLWVYEHSWWSFALLAFAMVVLRSLLTAIQVMLAWPTDERPPFGGVLRRATGFTLASSLVLAPFALLLFGFAAFAVSWLYLAAVPAAIVVSLLLHQGAVRRWWHDGPRLRSTGWLVLSVVVLTAAAGIIENTGPVSALAVVALAGLFDAIAWRRVVGAIVEVRESRLRPVAPVLFVAFVAGSVLAADAGFATATSPAAPTLESTTGPALLAGTRAVLVAAGFSSRLGRSVSIPTLPRADTPVRFSYAGSDPSGRPLPYGAQATRTSIPRLARRMAIQVERLRRTTGRPVDIVGISEGAAVVEDFLAHMPRPPVAAVVLLSPLQQPGSVTYPSGGKSGWGAVAGDGLQLLSSLLSPISTGVDLSPHQPFLRSLVDPALVASMSTPCRACEQVRELDVVPLADALAGVPRQRAGAETIVVAGFHGADLSDPTVARAVVDALSGRRVPENRTDAALASLIGACASAWRVPALRPSLR